MTNKLKIKNKLLLYSFVIQFFILITFSGTLYQVYKNSTIETIQNTLNIVLLDIYHDISEDKIESLDKKIKNIQDDLFDEEDEFNFSPLELRLIEIKDKDLKVLKSTNFPKDFFPKYEELKNYQIEEPFFKIENGYIYEILKGKVGNKVFLLEAATTENHLTIVLDKLFFNLLIVIPIILLLATIGNYFLIYKSFKPIQELLENLKKIQINSLSKRLERTNNKDEIDLLNKEINNLLSRLEISFEKVSQFSSNASHELKTPLTIIRGEIELALRKDRTKVEYKETLENCQDEVLLIQQTVDHLLFLAKSKDYLETNIEELYLDELSLDCIKELRSYAKLKKVHLDTKIQEAISFEGNKELLKIAIKNIIKNAIAFSFENRTVKISNYSDKDFNIISVEDTGIGIKEEEQEKVFEEFYRTDKSRNKDSGGTGLGLAICKKILLMHNGEIELKSSENIGTTISLKFQK